jgi:hypothetical protein
MAEIAHADVPRLAGTEAVEFVSCAEGGSLH